MSCLTSLARPQGLLVSSSAVRGALPSTWRLLRRRRVALRSTQEELDEAIPAKQSEEEMWKTLKPMELVQFSSVFYVGMTVTAVLLGRTSGVPVLRDLGGPLDAGGAFLWSLPMLGSMFGTAILADKLPPLAKIKRLLQTTILPILRRLPPWGPLVLALGAGIGEEAFFRGWMQPALVQKLMESSPEYASLGGLLGTSLIFGLGHAVTGTYFIWACVFGALMGVEYNTIGLPAVALTHAFYDWVAFLTLTSMWTPLQKKSENDGI